MGVSFIGVDQWLYTGKKDISQNSGKKQTGNFDKHIDNCLRSDRVGDEREVYMSKIEYFNEDGMDNNGRCLTDNAPKEIAVFENQIDLFGAQEEFL